jgi:hypothetical protein
MVEKTFTNVLGDGRVIKNKPGYDYSYLDDRGIIKEGTRVNDKIIMIGLTTNDTTNGDKRIDESVPCKKGQLGVVDKTFITEGEEGHRIAKVRIREERIPALGDKMASRAGQKGTVGLIIPERDMPFTKDGIRPDIIINPHAIPSRMTIGQLLETLLAKGAVVYGAFGDCTAFNQDINKVKCFGEHLNKMGYHSSGNEIMYNGMTGEQIETEVFVGPTYYMRLKHMVKDKINFRALGPNAGLTRQPVSGRANDGGLRVGEMERDSMAGHGITNFLKESMMERADKYYMAVCNQTGMMAIYNPSKNIFMSPMADGPIKFTGFSDELRLEKITKFGRQFSIVAIPYSMKLFIQELQAMNIQMRIITEDNIDQIQNLSLSSNTLGNILGDNESSLEQLIHKIVSPALVKKGGDPNDKEEDKGEDKGDKEDKGEETKENDDDTNIIEPENILDSIVPMDEQEGGKKEKKEIEFQPIDTIELDETDEVNQDEPIDSPFKLGQMVNLRGDTTNPYRAWKIKNIGNKFVTVETDDMENLIESDSIKVVSFLDIIYPMQQQGLMQPLPPQQQGVNPTMVPMQQQPPSINIKFVNGPDHSIESSAPVVNTNTDSPEEEEQNNKVKGGSSLNETAEAGDGSIDFKKLIINKL